MCRMLGYFKNVHGDVNLWKHTLVMESTCIINDISALKYQNQRALGDYIKLR